VKWQLAWAQRAIREAQRLDPAVRQRIVVALDRYAEDEHGDVVRLAATDPPEWRLRVGSWRVRFQRDSSSKTLHILRVLPRGKAYR
jgi:mRNA-degrading endonuclease RelE of RelBE toxin-antitoxin system